VAKMGLQNSRKVISRAVSLVFGFVALDLSSYIKILLNSSNIHDGDANGPIHNYTGHIQESSRPSVGPFLFLFSFSSLA
jgi:hypothetical protein